MLYWCDHNHGIVIFLFCNQFKVAWFTSFIFKALSIYLSTRRKLLLEDSDYISKIIVPDEKIYSKQGGIISTNCSLALWVCCILLKLKFNVLCVTVLIVQSYCNFNERPISILQLMRCFGIILRKIDFKSEVSIDC